ncbi:AAA family ATPase [Thiospirochaeta perfilievii]|uniref:AAA family ATPase n=1 Tax=Thiospirochaeta perfilievii TaxID=252967 RepID=A0A5C1Q8Y3_9SPIO|nr:ATP-binding protein [Thiospirochaeta perfilievii]QEN03336.1 AAA family ATPase [Thiospirochaeta perfilievii]
MFNRASKKQSKLRLALFGPSGGGKTFTALRIATGIGGNIAVIDSEKGSASKYADRFNFDVAELPKPTIENYIKLIHEARNYNVLILDSLSHGWQELLEEVDRIAKSKYKGNTWSAWSEGTPKQTALINAILNFDGHIIATMRAKTEWTTERDGNGKVKPVRVSLAPSQGKGIEYEFDLLMQISTDHIGQVIKDRTGKYQDEIIDRPGEDFGKALKDWLSEGVHQELKPIKLKAVNNVGHDPKEHLFPITSDAHHELNKLMKESKDLFSNTHFQWIIDQIKNDTTGNKVLEMNEHVLSVIASIEVKVV